MANTVDTMAPEVLLRKIIDGSLEELEDELVTSLVPYAFAYIQSLGRLELPNLSSLKTYMARNTSLEKVNFPKATATGRYTAQGAFREIDELEVAVLPKVQEIGEHYLIYDTNLRAIDLTDINTIYARSMTNDQSFDTLIIRKSSVPTLQSVEAFSSTPFSSNGTGGTLFVHQSLISQYESATNWSTILNYSNNQILPIEGSEYENYYADGTPILSGGGITNRYILDLTIRLLTLFAKGVMAYG